MVGCIRGAVAADSGRLFKPFDAGTKRKRPRLIKTISAVENRGKLVLTVPSDRPPCASLRYSRAFPV